MHGRGETDDNQGVVCGRGLAPAWQVTWAPPMRRPPPRSIEAFLSLDRPRVIAHRGASGLMPENTLAAFARAIELGADMVELDVALSRDDELVVIHDATLERTTSGSGRVRDKTLQELQQLEAGRSAGFGPDHATQRIPTLAAVLDLAQERTLLNIEIKEEAVTDRCAGGVADLVIGLVLDHRLADRTILSSFDPRALAHARRIAPRICRASLFNAEHHRGMSPVSVIEGDGTVLLGVSRTQVNEEMVEHCHQCGALVAVYTVNEVSEMEQVLAIGVDALFTDRPDRMIRLLDH